MAIFKFGRAVQPAIANRLGSHMLTAKNLTITRGDHVLCSRVNFTLASGQILHIQGSNGIGKTTLLMMLAGLLPCADFDQASLTWGNQTPKDWSVLYIGHLAGLNSGLTVRENLKFLQALHLSSEASLATALAAMDLLGYEDILVSQLSSGQKRRVSLALLWLTDDADQLWILDEPFTALDARMIKRVSERLIQYCLLGGRVILTSHQPLNISTEVLDLAQCVVQSDEIIFAEASDCE